jgi:hypothetical protein
VYHPQLRVWEGAGENADMRLFHQVCVKYRRMPRAWEMGVVGGATVLNEIQQPSGLRQLVGAPTVPSAFIARSGKWNQSRHIMSALVTLSSNWSCQFMSFHVIRANSWQICFPRPSATASLSGRGKNTK